ncbi:MAG: sigma-70 family RNA polymerase sigma factor [Opitutaceae bacterium]|nr:sigma-70 family RNA polymerase sigma factor [Opitutaceae bacterium]
MAPDHPAQAYAALPVRRLVEELGRAVRGEVGGAEADAVYTAFYLRYYFYLMAVAKRALALAYSPDEQLEIVRDVLVAFYRGCDKFVFAPAPSNTDSENLLKAYLGRIAQRRAWKVAAFRRQFQAVDPDVLDRIAGTPSTVLRFSPEAEPAPSERSPRHAAIREWYCALSPRDQDVLHAGFIDYPFQRRMPKGLPERLARKHGVSTSALRHLKERLRREFYTKFGPP